MNALMTSDTPLFQTPPTPQALAISQQLQIDQLEKTIDDLSTLRWDLEDKIQNFTINIYQLESTRDGLKETLYRTKNDLQETFKELDTCRKNYNYLAEQLKYQTETVEIAKKEMEKLRASKISDEHLARKLLELVEENRKLKSEVSVFDDRVDRIKAEYEQKAIRAYEAPPQEIIKYQQQVTRLLDEKVQLEQKLKDITTTQTAEMEEKKGLVEDLARQNRRYDKLYTATNTLINGLATIKDIGPWDIIRSPKNPRIIASTALKEYVKQVNDIK